MTAVSKEETDEIECCSPSSSVSHVPMTAPGMGATLDVGTLSPAYVYSIFHFDAIDTPSRTVDVTTHDRQR